MRGGILAGVLALTLAGCGGVLPHESQVDATRFQTHAQLMAAYHGIVPGKTKLADLAGLGFDPMTTPNTEVLSYPQIVDHFMPSETMTIAMLPPAVQRCLETQTSCSAYLYTLKHTSRHRHGGVVPDLLGVERDTVDSGWAVQIVLLLDGDHVVYKLMSGQPNIENRTDKSQPLGPLQDIGTSLNPPAKPAH